MGMGQLWLKRVGHLWLKWVGHLGLKWVGHLWLKWVGQLWQSEILFLDMLKKSLVFRGVPFPVLAWPRVSVPLNSRPMAYYRKSGTTSRLRLALSEEPSSQKRWRSFCDRGQRAQVNAFPLVISSLTVKGDARMSERTSSLQRSISTAVSSSLSP